MTESWDCAEARVALGVYVLGAIDPAERALVDAHLATCRDCRDELAGLAGIPALLARVNPEELERISDESPRTERIDEQAPPELIDTVVDLAAARRRRSRWRYAAAAAAVAAVAGGVFGGLAESAPRVAASPPAIAFSPGETSWETAAATSKASGVQATVAYGHERWGTVLAAKVMGIPVGTTCVLWVTHKDGTRTEAMSWSAADDEGTVWYWGSLPMPSTSKGIDAFQITAGSKLLVTVHPD